MSWAKKRLAFFIVCLFASSVFADTYVKERLYVNKKENKLVTKGSDGKSENVKLVSLKKKKKPKKKKWKKKVAKKKSKKKKKSAKRKIVKKKKSKSKKTIISSMKTCAVYNPPGKKETIVVEATSGKRKIKKKKRCRTYRKTKKNGRSVLVIEVEENQI